MIYFPSGLVCSVKGGKTMSLFSNGFWLLDSCHADTSFERYFNVLCALQKCPVPQYTFVILIFSLHQDFSRHHLAWNMVSLQWLSSFLSTATQFNKDVPGLLLEIKVFLEHCNKRGNIIRSGRLHLKSSNTLVIFGEKYNMALKARVVTLEWIRDYPLGWMRDYHLSLMRDSSLSRQREWFVFIPCFNLRFLDLQKLQSFACTLQDWLSRHFTSTVFHVFV